MIKNKEAEILLLGLPNSGKSTLINALTTVSYTHLRAHET